MDSIWAHILLWPAWAMVLLSAVRYAHREAGRNEKCARLGKQLIVGGTLALAGFVLFGRSLGPVLGFLGGNLVLMAIFSALFAGVAMVEQASKARR